MASVSRKPIARSRRARQNASSIGAVVARDHAQRDLRLVAEQRVAEHALARAAHGTTTPGSTSRTSVTSER